ncbi:hypothetical protein R3W88_031919 [Solanum pinnatisectum]|uniref:Uncharacterized protein n=1 Tax=Solanum pinnatisectum TaxID=50273 RepID=A0AAV9LRK4_9SOLN|nr:hypothetical protein R3W88_031919 [Solanum pinnatisectum]
MANLTKLEFVALNSSGKNYLSWVLNAEIHLDAMDLGDTIKIENKESKQDCAKAMIFLCYHIEEILKIEYLTVKDPLMVIHPKERYDWMHLRLQDFKSIHEYNSVMFRITSQLKLCGDTVSDIDMMEKTFSIFHASNGFKKYLELISHLLVAKKKNDLLMKNHENRPTRSTPFSEVNEVYAHHARRGRGHGHGRGRNYYQEGHYARDCRTPKHLVELYQESLRKNDNNPEANFITDHVDITHLDVADFFTHSEGKIDQLIGDNLWIWKNNHG